MIGDFLYGLTARDSQLARHEIFRRRFIQSSAATTVADTIRVTRNNILLINTVTWFATAGALQNVVEMAASFQQMDENENAVGEPFSFIRHDIDERKTFQGFELWVPPQHIVTLQTFFDAGVAANFHEWNVFGLLLPRGNVIS